MKLHRLGTLAVLALLALAAPAAASPVTVNLRIEGSAGTVFEGPVTTDAKMITTAAGGTHECDGTNGSTSNPPGGTPTTALDDASIAHSFTWDGTYDSGFADFFVQRIASDGQVGVFGDSFWDVSANRVELSVGGCQLRVNDGDTVLFAWTKFGEKNLQLTAPAKAQAGTPVSVAVQEYGSNGALAPAAGASVGGATTDASGHATIRFPAAGVQHLKATRSDAIRSNAADVCVYTPGGGACDTPGGQPRGAIHDSLPPNVTVAGIRNGARFRRGHGPRKLSGKASDGGGLFQVYFRLIRRTSAGCQWYSSKRSVFTNPHSSCTPRFQRVGSKGSWSYLLPKRLPKGGYTLEEKAVDLAFNAARARVKFRVLG